MLDVLVSRRRWSPLASCLLAWAGLSACESSPRFVTPEPVVEQDPIVTPMRRSDAAPPSAAAPKEVPKAATKAVPKPPDRAERSTPEQRRAAQQSLDDRLRKDWNKVVGPKPSFAAAKALNDLGVIEFENDDLALRSPRLAAWFVFLDRKGRLCQSLVMPVANEWTGRRRGSGTRILPVKVPMFSDGDAADLYRRITGKPHPTIKGTLSPGYRAFLRQSREEVAAILERRKNRWK